MSHLSKKFNPINNMTLVNQGSTKLNRSLFYVGRAMARLQQAKNFFTLCKVTIGSNKELNKKVDLLVIIFTLCSKPREKNLMTIDYDKK